MSTLVARPGMHRRRVHATQAHDHQEDAGALADHADAQPGGRAGQRAHVVLDGEDGKLARVAAVPTGHDTEQQGCVR
jgi:hypothetical protein